jgi:iron complex outermembrane receptor protein
MTPQPWPFATLAGAALFAGLPCHAQNNPPADADVPVKTLGVVVVTGSRPTSLPTHIPTTIESITGREIEEKINATDSEDALKYLPSLLVRKRYIGDYNHAVLSTRASGTGNSARSLVYADGILLSNLLGNGASFAPRWGLVTPEEIERVDVLYGPFSAAYPGNSVGAVVDYLTRMPRVFEAHAKAGVFTQPFDLYGTHDTYSGRQASASLGNRDGAWSWWFNLSRLDSQSQPLVFATRLASEGPPPAEAVPGLNRFNQPWYILGTSSQYHTVQDHAKAKFAYDLSHTLRASYTLGYWHNRSQGQSASYLHDNAGNPVYTSRATDFPLTDEGLEHIMQALSVKSHTGTDFRWELAASAYDYHNDLQRRSGTALPAAASGGAGTLTDMQGTGWTTLAFKGSWRPAGEHLIDLGLQQDSHELATQVFTTSNWLGDSAESLVSTFRGRTRLRSAYAQDTWSVAPQWKSVLGARLEHWQAWDGLTANGPLAVAHPERVEHHVSPKAALAHELADNWVLKASLGRAVRMPTVSELYQGSVSATGTLMNGDPGLRPEKSWTSELSAEWALDDHQLRSALFFERTQDALYSQTNVTVTPNVTNIQNVDRIRTRGVELAWQARRLWLDSLEAIGSLTYTDSRIVRNDKLPASVGKYQPRVPLWRANLLATWRPAPDWSVTGGARYGGEQYGTLDNSDPNGMAYQGVSKFFSTDLRVRHRLTRQWSAALGVDNLNNQQYWNFHPYPQRTWSAELTFDL